MCVAAATHGEETLWCRSLGVDQGLSQNFITAIAQDHDGFLWFGTLSGLNRWDGYEFEVFTHAGDDPSSLSDASVLSLHVDAQGNLWVGTAKGLDCYEPANQKSAGTASGFAVQPARAGRRSN